MNRIILSFILALTGFSQAIGQGYNIKLDLQNFEPDTVFLGYYFGGSQYIKDTAYAAEKGQFVFSGKEELDGGVYIVVLPPDNEFFQVMINKGEQNFSLKADYNDITRTLKIKGSPDNNLFYEYLNFIQEAGKKAEPLRAAISANEKGASKEKEALEDINKMVKAKQEEIILKNPKSLTSILIGANMETPFPEFTGTEDEIQLKQYEFYKKHYFDHIDLSDPRIAQTPFLQDRIDYYLEKLTYQLPDSLIESIDYLLQEMEGNEKAYQYYLVQFLNEYAKSKIVGMDAVYVHLVDNYYAKGKAPWVEEEQLDKIVKNANTLRPILIGKTAPNLTLFKQDETRIQIHDMKADYTVLFFWAPDCGHCKKAMPNMVDFYNTYKDKGVDIFGVCTATGDKEKTCWEQEKALGIDIWLNTSDKYLRSRYKQVYDVQTTPQIFVLDKNKKIVFKKIGAEQLPGVLDFLIQQSLEKS